MHQAAIQSLGIVENKIRGKGPEVKSTNYKEKQKGQYKYNSTQNNYSESSEEERRQKRKEDARNIIAQARVNKSRHAWREENYEDNEKEMGVLCFTRRFAKRGYPKDSSYRTTSKNMTGRNNLPYGYRIICRQYRY
jgi:hypothetical protein